MSTREWSVALPSAVQESAVRHLKREDGQEDLCFGLWYPSQGLTRMSGLIESLVLPSRGDRRIHGNATFLPQYLERAIGEARNAGAGLVFMHSHPAPGWQDMSTDDIAAEQNNAGAVLAATGLPLLGMTMGATDAAWSARFWTKTAPKTYERRWCSQVRVSGDRLGLTFADRLVPKPRFKEELTRTISAWGASVQADIARLRIGIVGVGSVGSMIAEAVARTGIAHITLIDFDTVEIVNLDRLLHATRWDARMHRSKVNCLARGLHRIATADAFRADAVDASVTEESGFRAALDCDVLFSCVDRPWARSVLNFIAYAHLIPVVDGGIRIETTKRATLKRADWKTHIAGPARQCLECLGQYDPAFVQMEREGALDDPTYIQGLPTDHILRRNENVFAFSMATASQQMLQLLTAIIAPMGVANLGTQMYHFVPGVMDEPKFGHCSDNCLYPALTARGDRAELQVTGAHIGAEKARQHRRQAQATLPWQDRAFDYVRSYFLRR